MPWLLEPLAKSMVRHEPGARVVELGCGTGNYVLALAELRPNRAYFGFDLSEPMLTEARARSSRYAGVLASASKLRPLIVPQPHPSATDAVETGTAKGGARCGWRPWAELVPPRSPTALDPAVTGQRFVDGTGNGQFLACGGAGCSLYSATPGVSGPATALPGGEVPEGFIGTRLDGDAAEVCVTNASETMWCFDLTTWTSRPVEPALRAIPNAAPPPGGGATSCTTVTGDAMSLVSWQGIASTYTNTAVNGPPSAWAFTDQGALVRARLWDGQPACCCQRVEPLGVPLQVFWIDCEQAAELVLLTADAVYGHVCPVY